MMALNWNFETDLIGHIEYEGTERTRTIYDGNAFAIFLDEYEEDGEGYYSVACLYTDKKHAKACLGLSKTTEKKDPVFPDVIYFFENDELVERPFTRVVLKSSSKNAQELGQLLMKAYKNITITMSEEV